MKVLQMQENFQNISIRLPKQELKEIKISIANGEYLNMSDFIRTAIRNELNKNILDKQIKAKVNELFEKK